MTSEQSLRILDVQMENVLYYLKQLQDQMMALLVAMAGVPAIHQDVSLGARRGYQVLDGGHHQVHFATEGHSLGLGYHL
jgi:hypothetical protein